MFSEDYDAIIRQKFYYSILFFILSVGDLMKLRLFIGRANVTMPS